MKTIDVHPDISFETRFQICGGIIDKDAGIDEIDMIAFLFAPSGLSPVFIRVERVVTRAIWDSIMVN